MNQNNYNPYMNQDPNINQNPNINPNLNGNAMYPPKAPVYPIRKTKNKFLTFVFALMPGAGQMYQGLLKKGISIMSVFFAIAALSIFLYVPVINFALPIIWFYSFFDTINRINFSVDELRAIEDSYIMDCGIKNDGKITEIMKKRHLVVGWVIIIIAIYALFNIIILNNNGLIDRIFGEVAASYVYDVVRLIPKLIVPIICLFIGFKLIKGTAPKQQINQQNGGNDIEKETN
jgi:hypothetical protein